MKYWRPTQRKIILMWHKTFTNGGIRCHQTPRIVSDVPPFLLSLAFLSIVCFPCHQADSGPGTIIWMQQQPPPGCPSPLSWPSPLPCPSHPPHTSHSLIFILSFFSLCEWKSPQPTTPVSYILHGSCPSRAHPRALLSIWAQYLFRKGPRTQGWWPLGTASTVIWPPNF